MNVRGFLETSGRCRSSTAQGLYFPERHTRTNDFPPMEPSTQYRQFAHECRRFAEAAKTDEQRKILLEMEAVWTKLAKEAEVERPSS
jgi:hypothetical protein